MIPLREMAAGSAPELPDVVGFLYEEGLEILQGAGYLVEVAFVHLDSGKRARILRQRVKEGRTVELIVGCEFYDDPALK